jgi:hypothetical protein
MLTFSDPEDMRFILLDHLLGMKYNLSSDSCEDWYLGNGKTMANTIIEELDRKLIRRKDVIGLRGIFTDLREMFNLPQRSTPSPTRTPHRQRVKSEYTETIVDTFPPVPPRELASPLPESIDSHASFDIDPYIDMITPIYPSPRDSQTYSLQLLNPEQDESTTSTPNHRRSSVDADSVLSTTSTATGYQSVFSIMGALNMKQNNRISLMNRFTIREATREILSSEERGVEVDLDNVGKGLRRVASMGTLGVGSGLEVGVGEDGYESSYEGTHEIEEMKSLDSPKKNNFNSSYRRKSRSEADLSQWTSILNNPNARASTMPLRFDLTKTALRRRERITPDLTSLSAYDLGLQDTLPRTPKSPPHLRGFEFETTTPRAKYGLLDVRGAEGGGKKMNRQFAIVAGEGVTPTREGKFVLGDIGKNALEVIMGLFVVDDDGLRGKEGLGEGELRDVLEKVVEVGFREVGDLEKITWLIQMAKEVVSPSLLALPSRSPSLRAQSLDMHCAIEKATQALPILVSPSSIHLTPTGICSEADARHS